MMHVPGFRLARSGGIVSRGGAENAEWSAELALYRYHCNLREKAGRNSGNFFGVVGEAAEWGRAA
jgi:hypothetical protein